MVLFEYCHYFYVHSVIMWHRKKIISNGGDKRMDIVQLDGETTNSIPEDNINVAVR